MCAHSEGMVRTDEGEGDVRLGEGEKEYVKSKCDMFGSLAGFIYHGARCVENGPAW